MTVRVSHITVHCRDPHALSEFWGWVTMLDPAGNEFCVLRHRRHRDADGGF